MWLCEWKVLYLNFSRGNFFFWLFFSKHGNFWVLEWLIFENSENSQTSNAHNFCGNSPILLKLVMINLRIHIYQQEKNCRGIFFWFVDIEAQMSCFFQFFAKISQKSKNSIWGKYHWVTPLTTQKSKVSWLITIKIDLLKENEGYKPYFDLVRHVLFFHFLRKLCKN